MDSDSALIERELARFDPRVPVDSASTPPKSWYVEPAFLVRERSHVFARNWQFACPRAKLAKPGDYVRVDVLGESFIVLVDESGALRGFHNVCRHHAAELVSGEGCVQQLVCPYHGWTYGLDGVLVCAPEMGPMKGFTREGFSLPRVHVEAWGPLVFLHAGTPERSVASELVELERRLTDFGMDDLMWVARRRYPMGCNWKVFVDNYLDGGYHIAHLHKGLASQVDLGSYRTECFARSSIQTCASEVNATDIHGHDFKERIGKGALYAWIHPNFMVNRYGPILDTNWILPLAVDRCEVVFDYWYPASKVKADPQFVELSLAASDRVQQEDVGISESVQRGLGSSSYDQGRYAPAIEHAMHHFHRLLAADLRGTSNPTPAPGTTVGSSEPRSDRRARA